MKKKPKKRTSKFDSSQGWPARCIAPSCKRQHTGPRFHFLCAEHRDASARSIYAWQKSYYEGVFASVDRVSVSLRRVLVAYGIVPKGRRSR